MVSVGVRVATRHPVLENLGNFISPSYVGPNPQRRESLFAVS